MRKLSLVLVVIVFITVSINVGAADKIEVDIQSQKTGVEVRSQKVELDIKPAQKIGVEVFREILHVPSVFGKNDPIVYVKSKSKLKP